MAMTYLGYARGTKEWDVRDALIELGIPVHCPSKIEFLRVGKNRRAEPVETVYLPNYVFMELTPETFYKAKDVKYLASTFRVLNRDDMRSLSRFLTAAQKEYDEAMRIKGNRELMAEYTPGQALRLLDGSFGDVLLRFKKMVERPHDMYPKVQMEAEFMGQTVTLEADPLDVRKVV